MLCRPSLRWQIPCRWATRADALPLSSLVGVLFGRMLCRRCWLVGWMLCHFVCVADLRTFGGVVLFAGSVVWFRLGSWVRVLLAAVLCCRYIFLACVCVSSVFLCFQSFVLLCRSNSVWPHQDCVCNCFILNEKRAQARSRKKNGS